MAFGPGYALGRSATESPHETFFIYRDRAFTHADAHRRVQRLAGWLYRAGVRTGHTVRLRMGRSPDFLSSVCALSRLGAVVRLGVETSEADAEHPPRFVLCDPANLPVKPPADAPQHLCLGDTDAPLPRGVQPLVPPDVQPPDGPPPSPRPAPEAPALLVALNEQDALRMDNRAWAAAALYTAAVCRLKPADTIYGALPLGSPLALLCAMPPALIAHSRLALGDDLTPAGLWNDVRRYGASVVFVTGEMATALTTGRSDPADRENPVRCLVSTDLDAATARELSRRFRIPQVVSARIQPVGPQRRHHLELTTLRG
jgi:putative long chain acyl-CoA synthase